MIFETPEGATPLDEDELADLIPTHIATRPQLNEWEQENILEAEAWLLELTQDDLISEAFVRELHKRMFDNTWKWAGRYRTTDKNIGVHWRSISTSVRQTCDNVRYWIENNTFALDEIAVRLHHGLVSVHPFPNGNGRHSRLMADALLMQRDQPRFTWGRADLVKTSEVRDEYLRSLRQADVMNFADLLRFARS